VTESRGNLSQITGKGSQLFPITLVTTINTQKPNKNQKRKTTKKKTKKNSWKKLKKKNTKKNQKPTKEILNKCLKHTKNPNSNSKSTV